MTGTIAPPASAPELKRMKPLLRLEDYRRSFAFYLGELKRSVFDRLLFVENSGWGLDDFASMAKEFDDRVELISYDGMSTMPNAKRFQAECALLAYGFATARSLRRRSDVRVWKVMGRYIVRNLDHLIRRAPATLDFCVQCKNNRVNFVEFGVAGFSLDAAPSILKRVAAHPDIAKSDERLLRSMIDTGDFADFEVHPRLPVIPNLEGIRGKDDASYHGLKQRAIYAMRIAAHRLFPRLWI